MGFEIAVIVVLVLVNGLLAMSELAVITSRRARLRRLEREGLRGTATALRLLADPTRFLATVQIGITLVSVCAGAFGGITLGTSIGARLDAIPGVAPHGQPLGIGLVVVAVTFVSLLVGELVPKRAALHDPERVAAAVAPLLDVMSRIAAPLVWLLKACTDGLLGLFGLSTRRVARLTEDEIKSLVAEGARAGILAHQEREMIEAVLRLADRPVRVIMVQRPRIVWIDRNAPVADAVRILSAARYSRLPVCDGSLDRPLGITHAKRLLPHLLHGGALDPGAALVPPLLVTQTLPVLALLERFRESRAHMALVTDGGGFVVGLVTATDVLESIAGELPDRGEIVDPAIVMRADGSWLVDGTLPIDELEDRTGIRGLGPESADADYATVAGYVLHALGELPQVGQTVRREGVTIEVLDMDGPRIDKLLVTSASPAATQAPDG